MEPRNWCAAEVRKTFEEFVGNAREVLLSGGKKEAVEKVFFLTDTQFREICEDLVEEIGRRKAGTESNLRPGEGFSQKRNLIREQLALLEEDEMRGLVQDTLLVLKHKYAVQPEDRLECLDLLVKDLQVIVASNTPQESPAEVMKALEAAKRKIKDEKDVTLKMKEFIVYSRGVCSGQRADMTDLLDHLEASLGKGAISQSEAKQPSITPELEQALEDFCRGRGSKEYAKNIDALGNIPDAPERRQSKIQMTIQEFIRLAGLPDTPECAVGKLVAAFEDMETCVESRLPLEEFKSAAATLHERARNLLAALRPGPYGDLRELEKIQGAPQKINSEADAIYLAGLVYSAANKALP